MKKTLTILLVLTMLIFTSCAPEEIELTKFESVGLTANKTMDWQVTVEFLDLEQNLSVTEIDIIDTELEKVIVGYIASSIDAEEPETIYVESEASHRLTLTCNVNGEILDFYYKDDANLLVLKSTKDDGLKQTIDYTYYTPDIQLVTRLQSQIELAETIETISENPALYYSPEQLKASVDADELSTLGQEMGFEFFEETLPDESSTSCAIYSHVDIPGLLEEELLVVARNSAIDGTTQFLSIIGMEVTPLYNKVYVTTPESDFDLDMAITSHAAKVEKAYFHTSRWVVFIENDEVVDVVVIKSEQSSLTPDIPAPDPDAGYQ